MKIGPSQKFSEVQLHIPKLSASIMIGICDQTEFLTTGVLSLREEVTCRHFNPRT